MSRRPDVLKQSQLDDVSLALAIEKKMNDLTLSWKRIRGESLPIPDSLQPDMSRWRQMRERHELGSMKHTDAEKKSVKTVAQWTLDMNASLRNQKPVKLEWKD